MAYKKQLKDKDGNTIYPDVGLNLDDVVYSDDPESVGDDYIDPASYSTTEHKTGGTWIDGKPIYKKTITYDTNGSLDFSIGTGISNGDELVEFESSMKSTLDAKPKYGNLPVMLVDLGWYIGVRAIANDLSSIRIIANNANLVTGMVLHITMYYTKTTD